MCLGFSLLIHIGTLCQSFNLLLSSGVVGYVAFLSRKMSCLKGISVWGGTGEWFL